MWLDQIEAISLKTNLAKTYNKIFGSRIFSAAIFNAKCFSKTTDFVVINMQSNAALARFQINESNCDFLNF